MEDVFHTRSSVSNSNNPRTAAAASPFHILNGSNLLFFSSRPFLVLDLRFVNSVSSNFLPISRNPSLFSRFGFSACAENIQTSKMNIFAKKPSPKEVVRSSKRDMANATRGIEREIASLQLEEKKLVAEIKKTAKTGNEAATKILARQLVRLRQQIANLQGSRAQMRGIATHTQAMHANTSVANGMKSASKAMGAMNKQMAPAKQMKAIQEFQKQSAQLDMTSEMMSESLDNVLDDDEAEEETEELTNQVLDEIGVDVASQLSSAPKGRIAGKKSEDVGSSDVDELEKRLAALRNP